MNNNKELESGGLPLACLAVLLFALGACSNQPQAPRPGMVVVDGVTVPDIAPLPTAVPIPSTNLNYKAKIELGELLFFDGRLSKNNAISCAFCHLPTLGFADPKPVSLGVGGKGKRRVLSCIEP